MATQTHSYVTPVCNSLERFFQTSRPYLSFNQIPSGCTLHAVSHNGFAPALTAGDSVVVDKTDTLPAVGDMFLIEWASSGRREVVQVQECSFNSSLMVCRFLFKANVGMPNLAQTTHVDGPFKPEHLQQKLIGRVIGYFEPSAEVAQ